MKQRVLGRRGPTLREGRDPQGLRCRMRTSEVLVSRQSPVLLLATVVLGVGVAACGDGRARDMARVPAASVEQVRPSGYHDQRWGYTVQVPDGWHRASASLTPGLVDPREIFSVATFPLRRGDEFCESLERIPPGEAFVTIQERGLGAYGQEGFPRRPQSFEPDPDLPGSSTWPYCARGDHKPPIPMRDYWFGFSDAGRAFHVFVGVGKASPPELSRDAFGILNSLRLEPTVRPDWRAAG
jgi:hypothetical protein